MATTPPSPSTFDLSENRRLVTVLFADLSGSTTLGEQLDPEDLRGVLASFFSTLAREILRFGGTVDKYMGDAVMAVFGAPVAHEDDAERAISAAQAMHLAIEHLNDDLERQRGTRLALRIGINTGEVVAGLLAGDVQRAYTVVGDTVNTAQRFESAAQPGSVLVGKSTRDLTRHVFDFEELPPLSLKGKARPQPAYRVVGARFEAISLTELPLVGRDAELQHLAKALEAAANGRGGCVHLVGDAGIGKSRLVRELRARAPSDVLQVVSRCVSFENERPYALLARLLRDVVRVPSGEHEDAARAGIERVLEGMSPTLDPLDTASLLEVMGYGERSAIDPRSRQRVLLRLVRRLLAAYAERSPVLIVAEDLHWADPASSALLAEIARDIPSRRCMLLSTSRPGPPPPWRADVMNLEALAHAGARALVEAAFGAPVEATLVDTILARTSGNPFFIEEVARGLREDEVLVEKDGRVAARPGVTPRVPSTVQEVLEARLDRLPPGPKRALSIAAVCGRVFPRSVVRHLLADGDSLSALERERFILPQPVQHDQRYVFRHALIQEVAYNRQLQSQRRVTHAAIGEALETVYPGRLDEMVGDLAFHFGRGDRDDKALYWLVRAGDRARALFANTEALAQYRAALERATEPVGELDAASVLERIGDLETLIGRYDEAIDSLSKALERAASRTVAATASIYRRLGTAARLKGSFAQAEAWLEAGRAALGDTHDAEAARIELQVGQLQYRRGDFAIARTALEHAIALGQSLGEDNLVAEGLKQLGNVAVDTGDLRLAAEHYERSRALYERLEDLVGLADSHSNLGIIYRRSGRWDEALAEYQAALSIRERIGHLQGIATCHNNIAEVHRTRGDPSLAIPAYERAIETFESIGHASGIAVTLVGRGAALIELGEIEQGRADLFDAAQRFTAIGSTMYLPDLYRYLASAELQAGALQAAEAAAEQSLEYARAATARHQEAATLRVLGEIALARGEPASAQALLELSRESLSRLGDALELARTEAVLRRLAVDVG